MNTVIINDRSYETRVAILEGSSLVELYIERDIDNVQVGNIYKGLVMKVLPGMQSAFVDIGTEKTAFLNVSDLHVFDEDIDFQGKIQNILKEGQQVLVQVSKTPIGTKGPRVTTNISLAGRYLVLAPLIPNVGISRKIENQEDRKKLTDILNELFSINGYGLIARTASTEASEKLIRKDYEILVKTWEEIKKKESKQKGLIHLEEEISIRVIRDILTDDVEKIVVDNLKTYKTLFKYLNRYNSKSRKKLELYEDEVPIFEAYGIEHEIDRSIEKKIWLKSGGYIIIEQTEALVVIDVNTGRYVGSSKNVEETMLNTNLEAAKEIAYQLKLRNLGGIIIVDFIDMEKKENKEKVVAALKDGLKKDRAKTNVLGISELGLVEMTRKRTRESLKKSITTVCPYCEGRGHIKSFATISNEIFRQIERYLNDKEVKTIMVYLNKDLHDYIYQHRKLFIQELENKHSKAIVFEAEKSFHEEQYEISFKN